MSLEQIVHEFPFVDICLKGHRELWEDAKVEARVSRLSMEALQLTMEGIPWDERFAITCHVEIFDREGKEIPGQHRAENFETLGYALSRFFRYDKEWMEEVGYILYFVDDEIAKWRRHKDKNRLVRRVYHRQFVLFKMPKKQTLGQLLKKYNKRK